MQKHVFLGIA